MGEKRDQLIKRSKGRLYRQWREAVLLEGNYRCSLCGSTTELTADHIKPVVNFPELAFDVENGRILCNPCRVQDMLHSWQVGLFKNIRSNEVDI